MTTGTTAASEQKIRQRSTVAWDVGVDCVGIAVEPIAAQAAE
jgi:hypothetical protein